MDGSYSFASEPRAVKSKYRPEGGVANVGDALNIHSDPRVARGSTHASSSAVGSSTLRRGARGTSKKAPLLRRPDVFAVKPAPKKSQPLDLTPYLIEPEVAPETAEQGDQTDAFVPEAPVPDYYTRSLPPRSGVDVATQIDPMDQLFDFDYEVRPLLGVLVGKTLEAALREVEEEAELESIREDRSKFARERAEEAARVKSVEEGVQRVYAEKQAKVVKERARVRAEEGVRARVAAAVQGRLLAERVRAAAFTALEESGDLYDPDEKEVTDSVLPALYAAADRRTSALAGAARVLDGVIGEALRQQKIRQNTVWLARVAQQARASAQEDPVALPDPESASGDEGFIRIFLKGAPLGVPDMIGPIAVKGDESLGQTEAKIQQWLKENVGEFEPPEGGYLKLAYDGSDLELGDGSLLDAGVADEATLDVLE
eukprot:g609.t1